MEIAWYALYYPCKLQGAMVEHNSVFTASRYHGTMLEIAKGWQRHCRDFVGSNGTWYTLGQGVQACMYKTELIYATVISQTCTLSCPLFCSLLTNANEIYNMSQICQTST